MSYLEGDRWLDGPGLADWLEPHIPAMKGGWPEALRHRLRVWRRGVTADLFTVDPYLIKLGFHPVEVPDELWVERPTTAALLAAAKERGLVCRNGHPRTRENTYLRPNGRVECRVCKREARVRAAS